MVFQLLFYILLTFVIGAVLFIYFKLIRPQKQLYDIFHAQGINGEPFVPLIGQLPLIRRYLQSDKAVEFMKDLVEKHGNTFLLGFGPTTRLWIAEPDLLADVFSRTNAQNYIKPPIFSSVFVPIIGKQNLLVAEGDEHERARRMINPAFHFINLKSMVSIFTEQTAKTLENIFSKSSLNSDVDTTVDFQIELNLLTLSIITSSAFGSGYETTTDAKEIMCRIFSEALTATVYRATILVNQIPLISKLPFWKKNIVDKAAQTISDFVDQIIVDRRQGRTSSLSNGADLLDLLLSAVDDEGKSFTDQQIKEQSLTFVLAGSETTGNLLSWVFYVLTTHEDVLEACREEVDRVLPDGIEPTSEHLSELMICEAIINETLRFHPPVPQVSRFCIHEHTIGSERPLRIPAGSTITININGLHRRKDLWVRADEFDYTRWMRDPKTGLKPKLPHPYAYLPFAAGARNCIGQNFALLEAKIILAMFVQRCDFTLVPGQKIVPEFKITVRPKYGLWLKVRRRQK